MYYTWFRMRTDAQGRRGCEMWSYELCALLCIGYYYYYSTTKYNYHHILHRLLGIVCKLMIVQQETNTTFTLVRSRQNDVVYARIHDEGTPIGSQPYRLIAPHSRRRLLSECQLKFWNWTHCFWALRGFENNLLNVLQVHRIILKGSMPHYWATKNWNTNYSPTIHCIHPIYPSTYRTALVHILCKSCTRTQ